MLGAPNLNITPEEEELELTRLFTLIDLDLMFAENPDARVINNETLVSQKLSREFTDAIYSNSDGELGFVPTCSCGNIKGSVRVGLVCSLCGTTCSSQFVDTLTHTAWIGIPEVMAPIIHPIWYIILKTWTSIGRRDTSVIDIVLNPDEEIPEDLIPFIKGRGFEYFYKNKKAVLDMMLYEYPKTAKKPVVKWVELFRSVYEDRLFTRKLPILHSSLHPLKCNGGTLNYVDSTSKEILSVVIDLSAETFKQHAVTVSKKQASKIMFDIYQKAIAYYQLLIKDKLGAKEAMLRKHCYGSRIHFSMRSVVTPQDRVFPMDELILPWTMMVNILKLMILNHMTNRHFKSASESLEIFMKALTKYDPFVDEIIQTIISEFPLKKIPLAMGRNPTLAYGSILLFFVKDYGKDPAEETIAMNACVIETGNIDFDGDETYVMMIFEEKLRKDLSAIHPSQFVFSVTSPGLSDKMGMLKQNIVTLENYRRDDPDIDYYKELN